MQLTAEGIKKIGILTTLIRNRQLNANSVLFLDEPETTLHPEATRELVEMLMLMARAGMQIFLATHNYFGTII
jgi:predicted ATPase